MPHGRYFIRMWKSNINVRPFQCQVMGLLALEYLCLNDYANNWTKNHFCFSAILRSLHLDRFTGLILNGAILTSFELFARIPYTLRAKHYIDTIFIWPSFVLLDLSGIVPAMSPITPLETG